VLKIKLGLALLSATILVVQPAPVWAAPTAAEVQRKIDQLRTLAAEKFEAANEATLRIAQLEREKKALSSKEALIKVELDIASKFLARIAIQNFQGSGFGNSFELLLSTNPTQYLSDAAVLEIIGTRNAKALRDFKSTQQRYQASQFVLVDRTSNLVIEKAKLNREVTAAKKALAQATKVLTSLKKEDREKLLREEAGREKKILDSSKKYAQSYKGDNSRGSAALEYALKQIGDVYVWAAAGPTRWDCSGLTMRAYQQAGVSLPHSSRIQVKYGKSVSYSSLKPGDLLFFGKPISHVSMYMGGGKMVQAPRPGKKVEVVNLVRMFGKKPFVGARRL
jgi:cell wall-associated NlpC family hydrolase